MIGFEFAQRAFTEMALVVRSNPVEKEFQVQAPCFATAEVVS